MRFRKDMRKNIIIIVLVALAIRILMIFIMGRHISPEVWEYDTIAKNILEGRGYTYEQLSTIYRSFGYPVFPYFSALLLLLGKGQYLLTHIAQVVCSSTSCVIVYLIAQRVIHKTNIAFLSGLMAALHPGAVIYTTKVHELVLSMLILGIIIYLSSRVSRFSAGGLSLIGFLIGLGMLTRPTIAALLPALLVYFCLRFKNFKRAFVSFFLVCIVAATVLAPWIARNYSVHKRFIFITTSSAEHFWRGNNPHSSGSALAPDGKTILSKSPEFVKQLRSLTEIQQYDLFIRTALNFIKANPARFVSLVSKKFFHYLWFSPQSGLWYRSSWLFVYKAYYIMIVIFALAWFYLLRKNPGPDIPSTVLILTTFLFIGLIHSLFYVEGRHKWIVEPFLLIFSAGGIIYIKDKLIQCLKTKK